MSTTIQEQSHLPGEEQNQNHTNLVQHQKLDDNETNLMQKEHEEPKENQQVPDQSGTSLTEKINPQNQNEKLPEQHLKNSNSESPQKNEQDLNVQKQEESPQKETYAQGAKDEKNLPVSKNPEQVERKPEADHTKPFEKEENQQQDKKLNRDHQGSAEKETNPPVSKQQNEKQPEVDHTKPLEKEQNLNIQQQDKKSNSDHQGSAEKEKNLPISKDSEVQQKQDKKPNTEPVEKEKNFSTSKKQEVQQKDKKPETDHAKPTESLNIQQQENPEPVKQQKNQPTSQNAEVKQQPDKKPNADPVEKENNTPLSKSPETEKTTPKHENKKSEPEIKDKQNIKPGEKYQENDDSVQPSSQRNRDKSLETQNPQDRTNENDEKLPPKILESPVATTEKTQEVNPQEELAQKIGSIFNFFSTTKDNLVQSSDQAVEKLANIISNSKLGAIVQGHEYTPVITSEDIQQQHQETESSARRRKSSQTEQTPKALRNQSIENPLKNVKSPKKTTLPGKSPAGPDTKTMLLANDKVLTTKFQAKQPDFKNRNEIEEQIRQHKIQEILKQKKALESKLGSLTEQLVELQKAELSSSPNRSKSKPKETREEFLERKRKAIEFAKKMNQEQKAIENRNDQRREARQVVVNREIEALQKLADKKYERKKIMDFIKGQTEVVQKAKYGLSSLEEKKLELKNKREFDKDVLDQVNTRDPSEHELSHKLASKSSSKKLYKSPMLPQVLAHDAEVKKIESEKITKRKALHEKQVEYARGVKDVFLPKVQSKFEARKLKMGVYKSQQVEAHLLRNGKDGLYGYLDKMKNQLEGVNYQPKYKKKPMKHREEPADDDDVDRPPTDFADDEEHQNVNVAYGKQLVYELQDNWNLADGTLSSRMMSNKNQQDLRKNLSPRNPEANSKYAIKQKVIDGDHLSDTEQSVHHHAKRAQPQYEDDEENY